MTTRKHDCAFPAGLPLSLQARLAVEAAATGLRPAEIVTEALALYFAPRPPARPGSAVPRDTDTRGGQTSPPVRSC